MKKQNKTLVLNRCVYILVNFGLFQAFVVLFEKGLGLTTYKICIIVPFPPKKGKTQLEGITSTNSFELKE